MEIYLYRHGQTLYNTQGIIQGRGVDSSLNETGAAQAQAFFEVYKDVAFDRLITSTLKRTQETARPFEALGIPTERRSDLDEIGWGEWEGKKADKAMHEAYLGLLQAWAEGDYQKSLVGGDSAADMGLRLTGFMNYLRTLNDQKVLVCTHGGCMAYLMAILQGQPLSYMPKYKHKNTGLCLFHYDGTNFHLKLQDDISHLNNK
ncbi:histidine phosphatase family protein [Aureispira sp. CCB-QB1]|uniref:histidine phosphatase family protein n=1 Tax=Aureispira sp. CCB-QB1 TaxID=1313421 RepID=UPI000695CDA2|nr:histidine phosphatase family protein [Aureispira sp. CCB-QB1]